MKKQSMEAPPILIGAPTKNDSVSIEEILVAMTTTLTLVGASMYCFVLGYTESIGISDLPSYGSALKFSLYSLFNGFFGLVERHGSGYLVFVCGVVMLLATLSHLLWFKSKSVVLWYLSWLVLVVPAAFLVVRSWSIAVPIFLIAFAVWRLFESREQDSNGERGVRFLVFAKGLLVLLFIPIISYSFGFSQFLMIRDADSHFPMISGMIETDGAEYPLREYLVWKEDQTEYWVRCSKFHDGVVYAKGSNSMVPRRSNYAASVVCRNK